MRSRAVSLPFVCCASMRALAAAETGVGATLLELVDDVLHGAATLLNVMLKGLSSMAQVERKRPDVANWTGAQQQRFAEAKWHSKAPQWRRYEALIEIGDLNLDETGARDRLDHRPTGHARRPRAASWR